MQSVPYIPAHDYKNDPRFSFMFNSGINGVVFTHLQNGKVVKHEPNDAFLSMIGYSRTEVESDPEFLIHITTQAYKGISKAAIGSLHTTTDFNNYEKEYIHKNGSIVHVIGNARKIDDDVIVAFISDITKQRRAEEQLKATESLFKSFATSGIVGINFWNTSGKMWGVNQAYTDIHGYTEEDVTSPDFQWSQIPVEGEEHKFMEGLERVLKGETVKPYATQVIHKDGRIIDILVGYALIEGSKTEGICVTLDISREKQMERALKESEERFRFIYDSNLIGVSFTYFSEEGIIARDANEAFFKMIGYDKKEFDFKPKLWDEIIVADYDEIRKTAWQQLKTTKRNQNVTLQYYRKDKTIATLIVHSTILRNDLAAAVIIDISEQVAAEHSALQASKKKDEFLSIASHELKTPLTSLKASMQLLDVLLRDKDYELLPQFLQKSDKQVNKLMKLIDELLDVTRIDAGKMELQYEQFSAKELIETANEFLVISNKKCIATDRTGAVLIHADKGRIEQVIYNFLSNAIKYSVNDEEIEVEVSVTEEHLKFTVKDKGIGIPKEKLMYIFERFYRVDESGQKATGLGLGLYISAEIIRKHKGSITVDSEPEKGSVFSFTIPLHGS